MQTEDALRSIWAEVEGLHMHALVGDDRAPPGTRPIVLVHGAAVSSRHMAPTAEALAPHFPVYVPDLPGDGRSDDPPRALDAAGLADALAAWMEATGLRHCVTYAPRRSSCGSRDPIIPPRWAEEAARLLPNGRLAVIPGETHTIVVTASEKLAEAVVPFLSEQEGSA